jgi:fructokinase
MAALAFANAAGALTTTRSGAQPALPTREQVERFQSRQERTHG